MICRLLHRLPLVTWAQAMVRSAEGMEEYIESMAKAYR